MEKKVRKILSITTIVAICLVAIFLIFMLFGVFIFGDSSWSMVITCACLGIGGFFIINSYNMMLRNRILGLVSLVLISLSVLLIIIATWIQINSSLFLQITATIGIASILFNIIVSTRLNLGKNKLVLQILAYSIIIITDFVAVLGIFGIIDLVDILVWFIALIILSILGVIILKIVSKRVFDVQEFDNDNYIRITKEEYASLVEKANKYDEMNSKLQEFEKNKK